MENTKFDQMIQILDSLIFECASVEVASTEELLNFSVREVTARIERARVVLGLMDKFVKNELYHIIGMGDLTEGQLLTLCRKVRILTAHRPYLKPLAAASWQVGEIPAKAAYKCEVVKLKLTRELQ